MNLNPVTAIAKVVGSAWGTYQERKTQAKQIEGELSKDRLEYKKAKIKAKTDRVLQIGQESHSYDMQVLKNRQTTWLDEILGGAIILMTMLAFIPGTQEYVRLGWQAVSEAPFWFQFAWYTLIVSTLGGMTVLRILMGNKIGNGIKQKLETSVSPSTETPTPHQASQQTSQDDGAVADDAPPGRDNDTSESRDEDQRYYRRPGPPHGGGR